MNTLKLNKQNKELKTSAQGHRALVVKGQKPTGLNENFIAYNLNGKLTNFSHFPDTLLLISRTP